MKEKIKNFCINCNIEINFRSKRCRSCNNRLKIIQMRKCLICNNFVKSKDNRYCSMECYNKSKSLGIFNVSEDYIKTKINNCIDCNKKIGVKATRCHSCNLIYRNKNKIWTEKMRKDVGEKSKDRKWTEQSKIDKSEKMIIEYATGKRIHPRKGKTKETDASIAKMVEGNLEWRKNGGKPSKVVLGFFAIDIGHYVRSMWEANVARIIKFNNLSYEYEPKVFILKNEITYIPDFYIEKINLWIEVKGNYKGKELSFEKTDKFILETGNRVLKIDRENYKMLKSIYQYLVPNWDIKTDRNGTVLPYNSGL